MQPKIISDSGAQKTSTYVNELVQRSGSYYSAWLNSSDIQEAVKIPQQIKLSSAYSSTKK